MKFYKNLRYFNLLFARDFLNAKNFMQNRFQSKNIFSLLFRLNSSHKIKTQKYIPSQISESNKSQTFLSDLLMKSFIAQSTKRKFNLQSELEAKSFVELNQISLNRFHSFHLYSSTLDLGFAISLNHLPRSSSAEWIEMNLLQFAPFHRTGCSIQKKLSSEEIKESL